MNRKVSIGALAVFATVALCSFTPKPEPGVPSDQDLLKIVEDIPTAQAFLKDPIPEADLERIVNAGINAPSAMNRQPWHFTVVTNKDVIKSLSKQQKKSMKNMKRPAGADENGERPVPPAGGPGGFGGGDFPPFPGGGMPEGGFPEGGFPGGGERPAPPTGRGPKSGLGDSPAVIFISCTPGSEFDAGLACESMNDMANLLGYGTKIATSVTMLFKGDNKAELYQTLGVPEGQEIVSAILLGKVETVDAVTTATPRNAADQVVTIIK